MRLPRRYAPRNDIIATGAASSRNDIITSSDFALLAMTFLIVIAGLLYQAKQSLSTVIAGLR